MLLVLPLSQLPLLMPPGKDEFPCSGTTTRTMLTSPSTIARTQNPPPAASSVCAIA